MDEDLPPRTGPILLRPDPVDLTDRPVRGLALDLQDIVPVWGRSGCWQGIVPVGGDLPGVLDSWTWPEVLANAGVLLGIGAVAFAVALQLDDTEVTKEAWQ